MSKFIDIFPKLNSQNERLSFYSISWYSLIATIFLTPLAVGMIPFGEPFLWSWQFVLHVIVLLIGTAVSSGSFALAIAFDQTRIRWHWTLWFVLAAFFCTIVSTLLATDRLIALIGDGDDALSVFVVLALSLLYFLVVQFANSEKRFNTLVFSVSASGLVMSVVALSSQLFELRMFTPSFAEGKDSYIFQRGGEIMGNPDAVGVLLALVAVLLFGKFLFCAHRKEKIAYGIGVVIVMVSTIMTLQRAAWIGVIVGFLVLLAVSFFQKHVKAKQVLALIAVLVAIALAVVPFLATVQLQEKIANAYNDMFASKAFSRASMAKESIKMITHKPIFGSGPANYRVDWYMNRSDLTIAAAKNQYVHDPHVMPVYIAASFGIPVFVLMCIVFGYAFVVAIKRVAERQQVAMIAPVLIALLVSGLMSLANITTPIYLMFMAVLCALPIGIVAKTPAEKMSDVWTRVLLVTVVGIASLCIAVLGGAHFYGYRMMDKAQNAPSRLEGTRSYLTIGTEFPFIAQSSVVGLVLADQEVVATGKPLDDTLNQMVLKSESLHPNDFLIIRGVANYRVNLGIVQNNKQEIAAGLNLCRRAIDQFGFEPQLYKIYIIGLANSEELEQALQVSEEYLKLVPKDTVVIQLAERLKEAIGQKGGTW